MGITAPTTDRTTARRRGGGAARQGGRAMGGVGIACATVIEPQSRQSDIWSNGARHLATRGAGRRLCVRIRGIFRRFRPRSRREISGTDTSAAEFLVLDAFWHDRILAEPAHLV